MAFVPGHKHDLFLSDTHAEAVWVEASGKQLCEEFQVRTAEQMTVWRDALNLRLRQKWAAYVVDRFKNRASIVNGKASWFALAVAREYFRVGEPRFP